MEFTKDQLATIEVALVRLIEDSCNQAKEIAQASTTSEFVDLSLAARRAADARIMLDAIEKRKIAMAA